LKWRFMRQLGPVLSTDLSLTFQNKNGETDKNLFLHSLTHMDYSRLDSNTLKICQF
jgi:hypothetical protein